MKVLSHVTYRCETPARAMAHSCAAERSARGLPLTTRR